MADLQHFIAGAALLAAGSATWRLFSRRRRDASAARAYLQGFRYILSDEPDAALEELTRAVEVDARTVETYFALGALFRRTGEHERAIRLHQNMLLRADLQPPLRQQIELELALDYQRAGMLGRAAELYQKVVDADPGHREALLRLRQVHEEEHDWARAAEAQGRLAALGDGGHDILAHLLAEASLGESDLALAAGFAERAAQIAPASGHAAFALGVARQGQGRSQEAADALERACELEPELGPRAAEPLLSSAGAERALGFYARRLETCDHPALRVALARCMRAARPVEEIVEQLRRALALDGNYVEARLALGRALLETTMGEETRREMEGLLSGFGQQQPAFACRGCGHGYSELQFRCTRCQGWDTVRRVAAFPHPQG